MRIPTGRSYVVDQIERLVIENHDYRSLLDVEDDVCLLEWDIAVSKGDLEIFADIARTRSDSVLVAPYLLYTPDPVWAHRTWPGGTLTPEGAEPVRTGALTCNLFGLGMVYLPRAAIRGFRLSGWANHFGDVEFSMWHYHNVDTEVPITWAVQPVHLNYPGANT
jgi:hypothetical protein